MPEPQFKIVVGTGDWGSPLSYQPTFKTLDEAMAEARSYLEEQRKVGQTKTQLQARIEETREDGSVVSHVVR